MRLTKSAWIWATVLSFLSFSLPAWCQGVGASVNESLETVSIYVDTANGSDSNPGTATQPFQTISAAASLAETNNQNSIGTRVIINPGIYRESVTLNGNTDTTSLPITFQAAIPGTVIVSGAEVWTGWQSYVGNSNIYTNTWPYAWGLCAPDLTGPLEADIVLRREMVFVNGTPLTEVLSLNDVITGTFYVDESGGTIYISPPSGTNISTATVEVSVNPTVWSINNQSNLVMRGLTFEYGNPCRKQPAVSVQGSPTTNILFDQDNFLWNNAQAVAFNASAANFTIQNAVSNHNGQSGSQAYQVANGVFQNFETAFNNWRGAQGSYYAWDEAGAHFYAMHDFTGANMQTFYNQTHGVHFDTDNQNIQLTGYDSTGNVNSGLFIEKSEGPITLTGGSLCGDGLPSWSGVPQMGIGMRDSEYISVTGTNFVNYSPSLNVFVNALGGASVTNWQTGQTYLLFTQNLTLTSNIFETGANQQLFTDSAGSTDWTNFLTTYSGNTNTWWNASVTTPFTVPSGTTTEELTFPGWQSLTGQDLTSQFAPPSGNPSAGCWASPDSVDYWFSIPYSEATITVTAGSGGSAVWNAALFPLRFSGTAQLTYDGIQSIPGATASWSTNSIGPNGTANFTVSTSTTTPSGTYPVTMIANSGNITRTVTAFLSVM